MYAICTKISSPHVKDFRQIYDEILPFNLVHYFKIQQQRQSLPHFLEPRFIGNWDGSVHSTLEK